MDAAAEARRMMADLGLARRDLVSAPGADGSGRERREDARVQASVLSEVDARRNPRTNGNTAADEGDARAHRLRLWNTETTFEQDEVTGLLENRWSGQGHRAALRSRVQYDDHAEALDARYGEERRRYLQERGRDRFGDHASHPADRFDHAIPGGGSAQRRNFSATHNPQDRGRAAPRPQAADRVRAPSPRSFGTVRYEAGARRAGGGSATTPALSNPALEIAASMRAAAAQSASAVSNVSTPSASVPSRVNPSPPGPPSTTPTTGPTDSYVYDKKCHNLALWYASHPGGECDSYHQRYPERLQYLGPARNTLIRECILLARDGEQKEAARYTKAHPDRQWMVEAAQKAKMQVEQDGHAEIELYCSVHPYQMAFVRAAEAFFSPTTRETTHHANGERMVEEDVLAMTRDDKQVSNSHRSSPTKPSGSSVKTEQTTETVSSAPPTPARGFLVTTFFDVAGKFLGTHQTAVQAPVQVSMSITSRTSRFHPQGLIRSIEALAQSMVDRSDGLEGVELADDGLWVEEL